MCRVVPREQEMCLEFRKTRLMRLWGKDSEPGSEQGVEARISQQKAVCVLGSW